MGHELVLTILRGNTFPIANIVFTLGVVTVVLVLPVIIAGFILIYIRNKLIKNAKSSEGLLHCSVASSLRPGNVVIKRTSPLTFEGIFQLIYGMYMLVCVNKGSRYDAYKWADTISLRLGSDLSKSVREVTSCVDDDYKSIFSKLREVK